MGSYTIIGLMSGTSMDGLDLAHVRFTLCENDRWEFTVNQTETYKYPKRVLEKLQNVIKFSPQELLHLDKELGLLFSDRINAFIASNNIDKELVDAIASHGHTVFHQPENGFSHQIGCGETMSLRTGIPVINDFRQKDIAAGGQGAPLVPIGDKLLFSDLAEAFLNIGGISNICFPGELTAAFDVCPGNLPMNRIANNLGLEYDAEGLIAKSGSVDSVVLEQLNNLKFYNASPPKSLGVEWLIEHLYPIIDSIKEEKSALRTYVEHIAIQIANELNSANKKSVMITGGGAFNAFLIERIQSHYLGNIILPDAQLINFKEAIVFGFLGALYLSGRPNTLSTVTGAKYDTMGGVLHTPF